MCQWQWFRSQLDTLLLALLICSRAAAAQHCTLGCREQKELDPVHVSAKGVRPGRLIPSIQPRCGCSQVKTPHQHTSVCLIVCWKTCAPIHTALFCYCNRKPLPLNLFWEQESTCENSAQAVLQYKAKAKTARRILLHWPNTDTKKFSC